MPSLSSAVMSISIQFPDGPLTPNDRMQELLTSANETWSRSLERRLQELMDAGIARDRISIVTRHDCQACKGVGVTMSETVSQGGMGFALLPCEECPGICVDGNPIARMPAPRPLP